MAAGFTSFDVRALARRLALDRGPVRVLIADDDDFYADCVALALALDDRIELVGRAADGREAVALALRLRPEVVLMDVDMPGLDGIRATREVRARRAATRVVVVSGGDVDVGACVEAGATRFVAKGSSAEELREAVLDAAATPIPFPARSDEAVAAAG